MTVEKYASVRELDVKKDSIILLPRHSLSDATPFGFQEGKRSWRGSDTAFCYAMCDLKSANYGLICNG